MFCVTNIIIIIVRSAELGIIYFLIIEWYIFECWWQDYGLIYYLSNIDNTVLNFETIRVCILYNLF